MRLAAGGALLRLARAHDKRISPLEYFQLALTMQARPYPTEFCSCDYFIVVVLVVGTMAYAKAWQRLPG